jgi:hypothetical protein
MKFQEIHKQANRAGVDQLFSDAEVAMAMLDLARASQVPELKKTSFKEALKVYDLIRKHTPAVSLTRTEATALNKKMALLKLRLSLG